MKVALAADHAGYALKQRLLGEVRKLGHEAIDLGASSAEPSDYPDFARAAAEAVLAGRADRALLVCGSGAGACVAANKFKGIRAATCHDIFSAHQCVEDDDCNVLCLGARVVGEEPAVEIVGRYLSSVFSGAERHRRRLAKVAGFEEHFGG